MSIESKDNLLYLSNHFHLQITHFAYGTYPAADGMFTALSVNRLLFCLGSSDNEESYVEDADCHYAMQSGHFYFIPADHIAAVRLSKSMYFVSIQFLLDLYNGLDLFTSVNKILDFDDPALVERARQIFRIAPENVWSVKLLGITYDCIGTLLDHLELVELNLNEVYSPGLRLLSETCTAMTTVAELADLCKVNRDTFSRNFIRQNRITPKRFLTRCILRRAYTLLSSGEYRVYEVAKELKFSNEFYFSRFFKKHTGRTPKDFLKLHHSNF